MNRFEGLKYKEIATRLNVSERTVEVRIGKALLLLRQQLKDFCG
jgi:RNA polymerase sigma-70 factor (ECF subfamily)